MDPLWAFILGVAFGCVVAAIFVAYVASKIERDWGG